MENGLNSQGVTLFFAYGGNMNEAQIAARCVGPRFITAAQLPDYDLAFYGHSERWDGGLETAVRQRGGTLWGAVYELSGSAFDRLDAWQGVRLDGTGNYFHCPADVLGSDGRVYPTLMYKKTNLGEPTTPSAEYLAHIVAGARARGLPEEYIAKLRAVSTHRAQYDVPKAESTDRFLLNMFPSSCSC